MAGCSPVPPGRASRSPTYGWPVRTRQVGWRGRPGDAAVPVRLADPEVARLLGPGSRVDVVTPAADGDRPVVLAADAAVLTVVAAEADASAGPGQGSRGRLVLVALPRADAARVAAAALSEQVAVTLR